MKKSKGFLLSFLIIFIGWIGYYFYVNFYQGRSINGTELVSDEAIFVYETKEPIKAWNQLVNQPLWESLSRIKNFKNAENQLLSLDSLFGQSGNLDRLIKGNQFVISLHAVSKYDLDFLFSISLSKKQQKELMQLLEDKMDVGSKQSSRKYSGVTIYEFHNPSLTKPFTYAKIGNTFIGSYTSFLIEEAIRQSKSNDGNNFFSKYSHLFKALPESKGLGVLRITGKGLQRLAGVISRNTIPAIMDLDKNDVSANLDIIFKEGKIVLEGESFFNNTNTSDFKSYDAWNPSLFEQLISNRTIFLQQFHLVSGPKLKGIKNAAFVPKETILGDVEKKLEKAGFFDDLTGDLAYQVFELEDANSSDKIIVLYSKNVKETIEKLKLLGNTENDKKKNSLVTDFYLDHEIFFINIDEFPAHLFEGKFSGFKNTFISSVDSFVIMANSNKAIKMFLSDVKEDNVWGKSIAKKNYAKAFTQDAGLLVNLSLSKLWEGFFNQSTPEWKVFFQKHSAEIQMFDQINLSLKTTPNNHWISIEVVLNSNTTPLSGNVQVSTTKTVNLPYKITYGPKGIQNFIDKGVEFVVQDEMRILHLLNNDGDIVFSKSLDSEIVSEIFQIDYYRNGKLQLLFATKGRLYLIDRLGESIPGFPKGFPSEEVTHLNLVDYSNTKDYRYFIGTDENNIYLLNKDGNPLEGWNPKKLSGVLATKPSHHRIAGLGDQMVMLTQDGNLYLFNRKGEALHDTPTKLAQAINNPFMMLERGTVNETQMVTISATGEVIQANMKGEVLYRNQLVKPDKESKFYLLPDQNHNKFLCVIKEFNKITVFNHEYEQLFSINYLAENLEFQYFSFGSEKNIVVIIDPEQEFIYLHNLKGELLSTHPLSGDKKIDIKFLSSSNEYLIYSTQGKLFVEYRLPL